MTTSESLSRQEWQCGHVVCVVPVIETFTHGVLIRGFLTFGRAPDGDVKAAEPFGAPSCKRQTVPRLCFSFIRHHHSPAMPRPGSLPMQTPALARRRCASPGRVRGCRGMLPLLSRRVQRKFRPEQQIAHWHSQTAVQESFAHASSQPDRAWCGRYSEGPPICLGSFPCVSGRSK